jgi:hypothetical protein
VTNYEEMTDEQLDALIAERIYGWRRESYHFRGSGIDRFNKNTRWQRYERWTLDANTMIELIDEMRERGWAWSAHWLPSSDPYARFTKHREECGRYAGQIYEVAQFPALQRAVCIAALEALDEEVRHAECPTQEDAAL